MSKYSCYIENTKEAREGLEKLGYEDKMIKGNYILYACKGTSFTTAPNYPSFKLMQKEEVTNCLGNLPLFKALTAVRDDSDIKQWFTDGKVWCLCEENSIKEHLIYTKGDFTDLLDSKFHKATDKELIEKFKKKEE